MSPPGKHITGALVACLVSLAAVWVLNWGIVGRLSEVLFGLSPDACKNYYTVLWHVQWDRTASHFEGMHHPYGDHVAFADAQPALSNLLRLLHPTTEFTIGLMNTLMLFSVVFTTLLLYLILRRLKLPVSYSVVCALLMAFLSPQIQRLTGHYGLSYSWVIPLVVYLSLLHSEQRKWWQSLLIGLLLFVVSGLHMYYYAMAAFLITGSLFLEALYHRERRTLGQLCHWAIQVALPFLLIHGWLRYDVLITDRPHHPTGFLKSAANWRSVFLPVGFPEWRWLYKTFPCKCTFNGIAFTGSTVALYLLVTAIGKLRRFFTLRWAGLHRVVARNKMINYHFSSSVIILCISFGWPFVFNLENWLYLTGDFQQLRGIGRMAWVFYYCAGIVAAHGLWHYWSERRSRTAMLMLVLAMGLWGYQVVYYSISHRISPYRNIFTEEDRGTEPFGFTRDEYQAVIPLPWFHVGSENLSIPPKDEVLQQVLVQSLRTGIPITASEMSRTSFSQTWKQMQFVKDALCEPDILKDFSSSKPFLIWRDKRWPLSRGEKQLLSVSKTIFENDTLALSALETKEAVMKHDKVTSDIMAALPSDDSCCFNSGIFMATDTEHYVLFYNDSTGGYSGLMPFYDTLLNTKLPRLDTGQYSLSIWLRLNSDEMPSLRLKYIQSTEDDPALEWMDYRADELMDGIGQDGWMLVSLHFKIHAENATHQMILYKKGGRTRKYRYKSMLIIKDGVELFRKEKKMLWINNRIYTLPRLEHL